MAILMPSSQMDGMAYAGRRNGFGRKAECEVALPAMPAGLLGKLCGIETAKHLHYSIKLVITRCSSTQTFLYPVSIHRYRLLSPVSAAGTWPCAKVLNAGARKDGGCMPNRLTQTDKPPGISSNTDLSRLGSMMPIRPCSGACLIRAHRSHVGDKLRLLRHQSDNAHCLQEGLWDIAANNLKSWRGVWQHNHSVLSCLCHPSSSCVAASRDGRL